MQKKKKEEIEEKRKNQNARGKSTSIAQNTGSMIMKKDIDIRREHKIKRKPTVMQILEKDQDESYGSKIKKSHWLYLLDMEHADAVISDAFWYVICKICNPQPEFEQH